MIRVLHIFHEMANGGIEHFVMDNYRHIDRSRVQFDFLVSVDHKGFFDDEILSLGGKMYHAFPLKKNPLRNCRDIARIVKENHYDIVHRHTGSAFGYWDLRAARSGGAKHLILHSHNNLAGNLRLHFLCKKYLKFPCIQFACSEEAGQWLFDEADDVKIVRNAVDCNRFQFTDEVRDKTRKLLGIENKFVIGHIGRFELQKNHKRLLEIFSQICQTNPNSALVCVGVGSLQDECEKYAAELGIKEKVLFLGTRPDIPQLMSAFDVFVMPSIYEGLPFVLVEAQASGLPCVVSSNVPEESNIMDLVKFVALEQSDEYWADAILKCASDKGRQGCAAEMKKRGYDIYTNAEWLCEYYESLS